MASSSKTSAERMHFVVGRDSADRWVVIETHGLSGGLFADQEAALRFVREASQGRPGCVEIAEHQLDFRIAETMNGEEFA